MMGGIMMGGNKTLRVDIGFVQYLIMNLLNNEFTLTSSDNNNGYFKTRWTGLMSKDPRPKHPVSLLEHKITWVPIRPHGLTNQVFEYAIYHICIKKCLSYSHVHTSIFSCT